MADDTKTRLLEAMGARARARREELGLSVNDVAVKMGRTYQCIYGMERTGIESLRVVLEWAEALEMKAEKLTFGVSWSLGEQDVRKSNMLREAAELIDGRRGRRRDLVRRIREELGT